MVPSVHESLPAENSTAELDNSMKPFRYDSIYKGLQEHVTYTCKQMERFIITASRCAEMADLSKLPQKGQTSFSKSFLGMTSLCTNLGCSVSHSYGDMLKSTVTTFLPMCFSAPGNNCIGSRKEW